ncbi:MAG: CDP-glycerol glycerophosphotransferase family protein, partial [Candidatus Cyclonatronum sp.]|uniref:CDP-glycerol glycerophosphotransferase family protein n=1 Tax=Cyclonatronum sp. TaxID=3024185 RepID=UPI0025BA3735
MGLFRKTPYPVQWFFGLLSARLIPRFTPRARKVVLTSFHGDGYRGNPRVIFEALVQHPRINAVWLTRSPSLCEELRGRFGSEKVALQHSLRGLRELGEARAVFLTHGTSDFAFLRLPRHAAIIQTYHGLPTKKGEYLRPGTDAPPNWLHRKVLEYRFKPITHFLSSSPVVSDIFSRRFGIPVSGFRPTGYPMYEQLMQPANGTDELLSKLGIRKQTGEAAPKIILYAPTYRRRSRTRWFPFEDFDAQKLDDFLREENALMCLRPHPNDRPVPAALLRGSKRIILTDQRKVEQTEALVQGAAAIITDYSSIYLEGLLRDV